MESKPLGLGTSRTPPTDKLTLDLNTTAGLNEEMTAAMELLPDEMLVAIFRFLTPKDLLGAVPLVCKQWCAVARSKAAWRSAVVEYQHGHELDLARVVRLAPALRSLSLNRLKSCFGITEDVEEARRDKKRVTAFQRNMFTLLQSLLSGVSDVKYLCMKCTDKNPYQVRKFISKYADYLVGLNMDIEPPKQKVHGQHSEETYELRIKEYRTIFATIARMPHLESLRLLCYSTKPFRGLLSSGCFSLKKFTFITICLPRNILLWDALLNFGPRLTYLMLHFPSQDPCSKVRELLGRCSELRVARLSSWYLPALRDMAYLHTLHLDLYITRLDLEDAKVVAEFIHSSSVVANLSCLSVEILACDTEQEMTQSTVVRALAGTCSELRRLKVVDRSDNERWISHKHLDKLFHTCSKLEDLHLHMGSLDPRQMELIACLPRLRTLTLSVEGKVVDMPAINEIVEGMRTRQPVVHFTICLKRFPFQTTLTHPTSSHPSD